MLLQLMYFVCAIAAAVCLLTAVKIRRSKPYRSKKRQPRLPERQRRRQGQFGGAIRYDGRK